jgi:hypothetical protein
MNARLDWWQLHAGDAPHTTTKCHLMLTLSFGQPCSPVSTSDVTLSGSSCARQAICAGSERDSFSSHPTTCCWSLGCCCCCCCCPESCGASCIVSCCMLTVSTGWGEGTASCCCCCCNCCVMSACTCCHAPANASLLNRIAALLYTDPSPTCAARCLRSCCCSF